MAALLLGTPAPGPARAGFLIEADATAYMVGGGTNSKVERIT
jgi:hypothetical protein